MAARRPLPSEPIDVGTPYWCLLATVPFVWPREVALLASNDAPPFWLAVADDRTGSLLTDRRGDARADTEHGDDPGYGGAAPAEGDAPAGPAAADGGGGSGGR